MTKGVTNPDFASFKGAETAKHAAALASTIGCFRDENVRDLPQLADGGGMVNPTSCMERCTAAGFHFASVQPHQCHCGNHYGRHGRVNITECKLPCPRAGGSSFWCAITI